MELKRFYYPDADTLVVAVVDNCPQCGQSVTVTLVGPPNSFDPKIKFFCADHGSWLETLDIAILAASSSKER